MAENSRIEWTDVTWNPVTGCTRASAGCDNCYAVVMTKRLEAMGQAKYAGLVNLGKNHFNGVVRVHEDALKLPFSWKQPRRVFVNSMSDLFHPLVPFWFVDKVFAAMAVTPQHTYQVLTKRPERMAEYLGVGNTPGRIARAILEVDPCVVTDWHSLHAQQCHVAQWCDAQGLPDTARFRGQWPLPNVWLGTSCEDQATADARIPHLLQCPAPVRFLSCEPLLGPIEFSDVTKRSDAVQQLGKKALDGIQWMIVGGESGAKARPMHPNWPRSLRDQCQAAGVNFFFKQWGEWAPGENVDKAVTRTERVAWGFDGDWHFSTLTPHQSEEMHFEEQPDVYRGGKKTNGRLLDGVEWNEFPEVANA